LILKSDANDAYLPSLPTIPIPTLASMIMPTSLPPSPTEAVLFLVYWFIFLTIRAFWVGLHLQTQTDGARVDTVKNYSSSDFVDRNRSREIPSIMSTLSVF
jgi:hypothetical protein